MPDNLSPPTFNLWHEPWIDVEYPDGVLQTLSLAQVLTEAHEIHALYEPSPLVSLAIHRLLTAVLQYIHRPQRLSDLPPIWQAGQFSAAKIADFGAQYANRFDLFSLDEPFLQSADLTLQPQKGENAKPVAYLFHEQTAGTAVTHYNHVYDDSQILCAACSAKGLLLTPPFASSGGAGIKPSINGVPPIYIIPGGERLFQSLAASLVSKAYQPIPSQSAQVTDTAWWERPSPTLIGKSEELRRVGYLYSLLFPARRVRLHPVKLHQPCSRCGQQTTWGVRTMIFEMGESRPKDSEFWRDPFAAYRPQKEGKDAPLPIRPVEGRALWREFAGLFLPDKGDDASKAMRPAVLDQLEAVFAQEEQLLFPNGRIPLRTIGLRTDMKMKIFEWEENGFQLPPRLLRDAESAAKIKEAIEFAKKCDDTIKGTFSQYFGTGGNRYDSLRRQMSSQYWQALADPFLNKYITGHTAEADPDTLYHQWLDDALRLALATFTETVLSLPSTGTVPLPAKIGRYKTLHRTEIKMIRLREDAIDDCGKFLYGYRKKNHPKPQEVTE